MVAWLRVGFRKMEQPRKGVINPEKEYEFPSLEEGGDLVKYRFLAGVLLNLPNYHLPTSLNKEDSLAKLIEFKNKPRNKHSHKGPQGPHNGTKKVKPTQSQQHRAELVEKVNGESGTQKQMKASALQVLQYADHLYEECPKYYQPTKPTPLSQDDDIE
ncbi:hypothetical protein Moror_8630, partial [Moniliophthora roreri MCA 2997]